MHFQAAVEVAGENNNNLWGTDKENFLLQHAQVK